MSDGAGVRKGLVWGWIFLIPSKQQGWVFLGQGGQTSGSTLGLFSALESSPSHLLINLTEA